MGHHDNDDVWHKDKAEDQTKGQGQGQDQGQPEGAATPRHGDDSDEGQVSEGGSSAINSEANQGGADSVPDTPDDNPPFERPGSDFTEQSKGGGEESSRG